MSKPMKSELRATQSISRNDLFWRCSFFLEDGTWVSLCWTGYNDANWWDNVSADAAIATDSAGNRYRLHYDTLEVEVLDD